MPHICHGQNSEFTNHGDGHTIIDRELQWLMARDSGGMTQWPLAELQSSLGQF
jgi:hypothetical protein